MSTNRPFEKYEILYRLGMKIETQLPLRIGVGREEASVVEPDLPVIKDAFGKPIIPGSTLKGFFRANAERLLGNFLDGTKTRSIIESIFGDTARHASCIFFGDLKAVKAELDARKHIAIDPETGAVGRGRLFEVELVKEGAVFQGENLTARNISPCYLGFLYAVKALADGQLARIGGFKSRGYGGIKISFDKLSIILPGINLAALREGATRKPPIGTGWSVTFRVQEEVTTLEDKEKVEFKARILPDPGYLGSRIEVVEAEGLLARLTEQLEKYLAASVKESDHG